MVCPNFPVLLFSIQGGSSHSLALQLVTCLFRAPKNQPTYPKYPALPRGGLGQPLLLSRRKLFAFYVLSSGALALGSAAAAAAAGGDRCAEGH